MENLKQLWWRFYPNTDKEHWWMPLIWLPFMFWFFVSPLWKHASLSYWIVNTVVGLVFIALYLQAFARGGRTRLICTLIMLGIAVAVTPYNHNGTTLLIYCAAAGSFTTQRLRVAALMAVEGAVLLLYAYRLHFDIGFWTSMLLLIVLISLANHFAAVSHCQKEELRLANHEIEHLAKVAERERIARDLHDVLGHTLSLITLKSELARKLVDRDPERAKLEMQDVERTSRAALADVREAIRGYRSDGFFAELSRARAALETAGVTLQCSTASLELSPAQESVLAMVLREAVTNVVRHAEAQRCEVRLVKEAALCRLEIADDGCGCDAPEGNGLRGMRERLQTIGGSLERLTGKGTRLVIQLPLAPATSALTS
jgi:two-component system, NarL family, sensor histidine kinase DesK